MASKATVEYLVAGKKCTATGPGEGVGWGLKPQDFRVGGELWKTQKPQPKRGNRNSASKDSNLLAKHHSVWLSQLAGFHERAWKEISCCVCWETIFSLSDKSRGSALYNEPKHALGNLQLTCSRLPHSSMNRNIMRGLRLCTDRMQKKKYQAEPKHDSWLYGTSLRGTWCQRVAYALCENKQIRRDGQKERLKKRTKEGLTLLHPLWTLPCQNKSFERLIVTHLVPTTSTCLSSLCI